LYCVNSLLFLSHPVYSPQLQLIRLVDYEDEVCLYLVFHFLVELLSSGDCVMFLSNEFMMNSVRCLCGSVCPQRGFKNTQWPLNVSKKVCYKVSLWENWQRQSWKAFTHFTGLCLSVQK